MYKYQTTFHGYTLTQEDGGRVLVVDPTGQFVGRALDFSDARRMVDADRMLGER